MIGATRARADVASLQTCIQDCLRRDARCPGCRRPSRLDQLKAVPNRRDIGSLQIRCEYSVASDSKESKAGSGAGQCSGSSGAGGCSWVGDYGLDGANFKKHVADCKFGAVRCTIAGCDVRLPARAIKEHEKACPLELLTCANAGCGAAVARRDLQTHDAACPCKLVACPFAQSGCRDAVMVRLIRCWL